MEEDGTVEEDSMGDSGYLESQANNMDPLTVSSVIGWRQTHAHTLLNINR